MALLRLSQIMKDYYEVVTNLIICLSRMVENCFIDTNTWWLIS